MGARVIFQAPAILTRISMLKDGGLSLGFSTNELTVDEKTKLFSFYQQFGYVLFKESSFQESEIPEDDPTDSPKSPSQRLRAVLFVKFKQTAGHTDMLFEDYYVRELERIIRTEKRSLDD
jgi:hypothetical protein